MQVREGRKSRTTVCFQWFVAQEGREVGSLRWQVRSYPAVCEMKSCTPLWHEAHFQVKMLETLPFRSTFGSWDVEKVHATVARSTIPSQNIKQTVSDHFLEVVRLKKCRPWWHKAHSQVTSIKNWRSQTTFGRWDVEKVDAVVARSTFRSEKCQKLSVSEHFWKLRKRKR